MNELSTELVLNPDNPTERAMLINEREFQLEQRHAQALASSKLIPQAFQQNLPDCMIALEMSKRMNTGALEIMQNLYVVHGKPSFSSTYLIARINQSGIITGRLRFIHTGTPGSDSYGCYAVANDASTGEELKGTEITIGMAKSQGWWGRNGSKWPDMTEQMLCYRAAAFWSRIYAPDATLGFHTTDEVRDQPVEKEVNPRSDANDALNNAKLSQAETESLVPPEKPKRKRRTKAEIEANKQAEQQADETPAPGTPLTQELAQETLAKNGWLQVACDRLESTKNLAEVQDIETKVAARDLNTVERLVFAAHVNAVTANFE